MRIILTFVFVIFFVTGNLFCQTRTISGRIISEDLEELPVVSIHQIDTALIGKTDINGRFSIEIPSDTDSLILTFIGFEWTTIQLQADCDTLEVIMMYDVIYDFMSARKIERLRKKRFEKIPIIHQKAFDKGLFKTKTPCFNQSLNSYFVN
jgi:hypothetical protein